jgi:hypothetical protein
VCPGQLGMGLHLHGSGVHPPCGLLRRPAHPVAHTHMASVQFSRDGASHVLVSAAAGDVRRVPLAVALRLFLAVHRDDDAATSSSVVAVSMVTPGCPVGAPPPFYVWLSPHASPAAWPTWCDVPAPVPVTGGHLADQNARRRRRLKPGSGCRYRTRRPGRRATRAPPPASAPRLGRDASRRACGRGPGPGPLRGHGRPVQHRRGPRVRSSFFVAADRERSRGIFCTASITTPPGSPPAPRAGLQATLRAKHGRVAPRTAGVSRGPAFQLMNAQSLRDRLAEVGVRIALLTGVVVRTPQAVADSFVVPVGGVAVDEASQGDPNALCVPLCRGQPALDRACTRGLRPPGWTCRACCAAASGAEPWRATREGSGANRTQ